ncbi:TRAP transporter small permease [Shumkonia mesophila]|uniref:TRAP transporter small permease n=1 Tax=Shumkonia mesophila TaxID=2838854 RepID=UPI00293466FF|nr:TRAP transporter small permease [Shumkonia mesophila]
MTRESRLECVLEWCSIIVLIVMFSAVVVQIYARYFLEIAPAWTEEIGQYLLVWLTALGAGIALRSEGGFRGAVEFIANAMPPRLRHSVNLAFMALTLSFLCVLGYKTFYLVARKMEVRTPALEIPESYLYLGVLVMVVLMVWGLAYHMRKAIRTLAVGYQKPERAPSSHSEGFGEG